VKKKPSTILVADDSPSIRWVLSECFVGAGYKVIEVESGNAALEILNFNWIDIVVSDIDMTDGDGFYLLSEIKRRGKKMPSFLFLSGNKEVTRSQVFAHGAQGLLRKPFHSAELLQLIDGYRFES
jgi:CheY-like chemotaxis protein